MMSHCAQVHSQLSADAACFIPSWHRHTTTTTADTSAAVSSNDEVLQLNISIAQPFTVNQQIEQW